MRRWVSKKNAGVLLAVIVLATVVYYWRPSPPVTSRVPGPKYVGRGYASTPYGSPAGNPGRLKQLYRRKQGCGGGCSGGGGSCCQV